MTVREDARKRLDEMAGTLPLMTHQTAQDYDKPIRAFIDIYDSGDRESLYVDNVRAWAKEAGFKKKVADELGEMAETVYRTLRMIGR
jgi:hypothetical protein